ncbi:hypothetical protein CLV72_11336 [Allonocardiopsis opalescens]|uniref:Uncharacterized protein n=1 Tax=Allonocardiopsis opalescens TaxID=1144618 RepID=A0A2T0PSH1_9ACTN|nr:hypothetical protein CLV72_11336 [Allonocardiopsis opalescens]
MAGSLVSLVFAAVFFLANSGRLGAASVPVQAAGLLAAAALAAAVLRFRRAALDAHPAGPGGPPGRNPFTGRGYLAVVGIEAAALFGGLFVLNSVLGLTGVNIAWIALVVGTHFYALGALWRLPVFHVLATAMTLLGLAGFAVHALGGPPAAVDLVSGIGSGLCLLGTVAATLAASWPRPRAARAQPPSRA